VQCNVSALSVSQKKTSAHVIVEGYMRVCFRTRWFLQAGQQGRGGQQGMAQGRVRETHFATMTNSATLLAKVGSIAAAYTTVVKADEAYIVT
jgi:hypothetical protein